jgi:DNA-binding transcriptional ArsR family regulator
VDARTRLAELDAIFAALAHWSRRQILLAVVFRGGEMTAGDIADRFHHSWPTTSRHLRVLEDAGLLAHRREGRVRIYRVDRKKLALVRDFFRWLDPSLGRQRKHAR